MKRKIQEMLNRAEGLPYGFAQADLVAEAVRLADLSQDHDLRFRTRKEYLSAACFAGRTKELVVTYTWLLNHLGEYNQGEERRLLWPAKWVLGAVVTYSEFSAAQVEHFFKDATERYLNFNVSLRPLKIAEARYRLQQGDDEEVERLLTQATTLKRDGYADCLACESTSLAVPRLLIGNSSKAVEILEEAWNARLTCGEEPVRGKVSGTLAYAIEGRMKEALACHQAGYPKIARTEHLAILAWYALVYKLSVNRLNDALLILDRHFKIHLKTMNRNAAFYFFLAGRFLMNRYLEKGKKTLPFRSSESVPESFKNEKGEVLTEEFGSWMIDQATVIARAFDRRNQSNRYQSLLAADWPFPGQAGV